MAAVAVTDKRDCLGALLWSSGYLYTNSGIEAQTQTRQGTDTETQRHKDTERHRDSGIEAQRQRRQGTETETEATGHRENEAQTQRVGDEPVVSSW